MQAELFCARATCSGSLDSESRLIEACLALIGDRAALVPDELKLVGSSSLQRPCGAAAGDAAAVAELTRLIRAGADPLGDAFLALRSATQRRASGAVYTPQAIVGSMLRWLAAQCAPARLVDPGAGSGRFLLAAAALFPDARLLAAEPDPLAALMLRANAQALGFSHRLDVHVGDYRAMPLDAIEGTTAFIGNPPYVRHHDIAPAWKQWYRDQCAARGIKASALAGLHLHFFVQTLLIARHGDVGVFITSAEWLDVNYGAALRKLLTDWLGATHLQLLDPTLEVFPGTATTAAITGFRVGESTRPIRVQALARLDDMDRPTAAIEVPRDNFRAHSRWSLIVRRHAQPGTGGIELGELFRVHRGQVTGANAIWVARDNNRQLPERLLVPAVTKARDLIEAGEELRSSAGLRRVVELPADLDELSVDEAPAVRRFLAWARSCGADQGYVATHRKVWWAVGLREPAPILCTYMGRRPPQFTLNDCAARHINVAHGLYPRAPLDATLRRGIARWLNCNVDVKDGRTYAGGLTKFEPRELERLRLPELSEIE